MDLDEVTMMIRAVCSANKGPTSIQEVKREFYELNGTNIPYRDLGFDSLIEFLRSEPDKFKVINDTKTGELALMPIVDEEISTLRMLVSGQKSTKKKKKKPTKPLFRPGQSKYKQFQAHRSPMVLNTASQMRSRPTLIMNQRRQIESFVSKTVRFNIDEQIQSKAPEQKSKKISPEIIENLIITNAAYFLKEHEIFISHVVDCEKVYIRLVSPNFSEKYEAMFKEMNDYYFNSRKIRLMDLELNDVCVVLNQMKYHRVQIKKVLNEYEAECFHLDEGKTEIYSISDLYEINEKFLQVKFQAVLAKLHEFENLTQNMYLKESISQEINNKKLIAKKTSSNPLIISLFNAQNECLNEILIKNNSLFLKHKLDPNSEFTTTLTYIDLEAKLIYLEKPLNPLFSKFSHQFNKFYQDQNNEKILKVLNEAALRQIQDDDFVKNNLLAAKYDLDSNWYRVRYIRENPNSKQVLVLFVDFGNKDLVNLNELMIIPEQLTLYKNLPRQCFPCTLITDKNDLSYYKTLWYDNIKCDFKVIHINPTGMPSVEFVGISKENIDSPINHIESTIKTSETNNFTEKWVQDVNKIDSEINETKLIQNLNSMTIKVNDERVDVTLKDLPEVDLPVSAFVHIRYANNPFDFVVNLDHYVKTYEKLRQEMKNFYMDKLENYKVENFVKNCIYVYRLDESNYTRVKFENKFGNYGKVYDIDGGYYDAVKLNKLLAITKKFIELKPLAIKVRLASINYDLSNQWSNEAREFFLQKADKSKIFKSSVRKFNIESNVYEIELSESSIGSVNQSMINAGLALKGNF